MRLLSSQISSLQLTPCRAQVLLLLLLLLCLHPLLLLLLLLLLRRWCYGAGMRGAPGGRRGRLPLSLCRQL
jgi:hypothetical protein